VSHRVQNEQTENEENIHATLRLLAGRLRYCRRCEPRV